MAPLPPPGSAAAILAAARVGAGASMVLRPSLLTRPLGVDRVTARQTSWQATMIGGREIALGLGALAALRPTTADGGGDRKAWILAGVAADFTDAASMARAVRRRDVWTVPGLALTAVAALATFTGVRALRAAG